MKQIRRSNGDLIGFSKIFDDLFNNEAFSFPIPNTHSRVPAVNIKESGTGFELEMPTPGLSKSDIQIEINKDNLTISSKKEHNNEVKEGDRYVRREFNGYSFKRSFKLPNTIESDKIAADYTNGVLHVTIPKREEAKVKPARVVEIV